MLRAFAASSSSAALTLGTAAYRHTRWVAQSQPCLVRQRRCEQLQAAAAAGPRSMAAAAGAGQDAAVAAAAPPPPPEDTLLQYVVLRRDLWAELEWPLGSVVAQGCHAATAALWQSRDAAATQEYCAPQNIDHMHKVVLEIKGETQLRGLSAKLEEAGVAHKLWVEQPEDYATCLATAPAPKSRVAPLLKKLKLCRGT